MQISLKAARVNAELSQSDVAAKLEKSKTTIVSWEKGKSMPNVTEVNKLCELYGCSYDDIRWNVKSQEESKDR